MITIFKLLKKRKPADVIFLGGEKLRLTALYYIEVDYNKCRIKKGRRFIDDIEGKAFVRNNITDVTHKFNHNGFFSVDLKVLNRMVEHKDLKCQNLQNHN